MGSVRNSVLVDTVEEAFYDAKGDEAADVNVGQLTTMYNAPVSERYAMAQRAVEIYDGGAGRGYHRGGCSCWVEARSSFEFGGIGAERGVGRCDIVSAFVLHFGVGDEDADLSCRGVDSAELEDVEE